MSDDRWSARWASAWQALGSAPPDAPVLDELLARYAEPQRAYHTARHLDECFRRFARVLDRTASPGEVAVALFYHDAVYDPRASDNEVRSAELAANVLRAQGIAPEVIDRIGSLIMATRHDAPPSTTDAALLVDIDLGILAAPAERFDEYEREVRLEYGFVPGIIFRHKRREILRGFLARERIYSSGAFDEDEARARENLGRSVARL
jgi:predicted metal-dependent HD superfamily phosphohydrolase